MSRLVVLSLLLLVTLWSNTNADAEEATPETPATPAAAATAEPVKSKLKIAANDTAITIDDMHCAGCAKKIAGRLYRLKGVVKVRTDVKANLAIVTPQAKKEVDAKAAWEAVQKAGFQPTKLVGPQGTYVSHEKTKKPEKVAEILAPKRG